MQLWVTKGTRQRLKVLAAMNGVEMMEAIQACVETQEQLRKLAAAQDISVSELIRNLVAAVTLPPDQPKSEPAPDGSSDATD